jgi:hypothetical protein
MEAATLYPISTDAISTAAATRSARGSEAAEPLEQP